MKLVQGFTPAWLETICAGIHMPPEAADRVLKTLPAVNQPAVIVLAGGLAQPDTALMAQQALRRQLDPDPDGWKMLTVMLCAACLAQQPMEQQGMGMDVYLATMGMFSRFVKEHSRQFGRCGFDRDWWTWRILCGRLVRLERWNTSRRNTRDRPLRAWFPVSPACICIFPPTPISPTRPAGRATPGPGPGGSCP